MDLLLRAVQGDASWAGTDKAGLHAGGLPPGSPASYPLHDLEPTALPLGATGSAFVDTGK